MSGNRSTHIRLTSHPGAQAPGSLSDPLGRGRSAQARPDHRHGRQSGRSQRDRHAWRLLFALSGAGRLVRRAQSDPAAGSAQHLAGRRRSGRIRNGRRRARSSRSIRSAIWRPTSSPTEIAEGVDIRPTIAITKARLTMAELHEAIRLGRIAIDGEIVHENGDVSVTKAAIDPVWYLPGIAAALQCRRGPAAAHAVRADRRHVSGTGDAARSRRVPAADRRHHDLYLRRSGGARPIRSARLPAVFMTSATAPTCSAPISAPAGLI